MKLIIDHANPARIKELYSCFPVSGVTTNPSILAKEKRAPYEVLLEIRSFIGPQAQLHVQVIGQTADQILKEAEIISERLGQNTLVKVPVTLEGLKAIKRLSAKGIPVTATAIYTQIQAYLAGEAGADYAAPYVNRIDNLGSDGIQTAKDIHDIFQKNGMKTQVLAASFKNTQQVLELAKYGIGACTVAPDVMEGFLRLASVTEAVTQFQTEFEALCGPGKTMEQ